MDNKVVIKTTMQSELSRQNEILESTVKEAVEMVKAKFKF
jgi:hypothetical protein